MEPPEGKVVEGALKALPTVVLSNAEAKSDTQNDAEEAIGVGERGRDRAKCVLIFEPLLSGYSGVPSGTWHASPSREELGKPRRYGSDGAGFGGW